MEVQGTTNGKGKAWVTTNKKKKNILLLNCGRCWRRLDNRQINSTWNSGGQNWPVWEGREKGHFEAWKQIFAFKKKCFSHVKLQAGLKSPSSSTRYLYSTHLTHIKVCECTRCSVGHYQWTFYIHLAVSMPSLSLTKGGGVKQSNERINSSVFL